MVAAAYPTYDATSSKISKRKIGLKIYQTIIDRGGRFLDLEGKPMDRPKSILKVMKALKDAKTWTSDAKRLAKRKRDEQKSREVHQEAKKPRIEESPVALTAPVKQEDPVAVAAVVAAVAAVDDATKAAVDEDSDPKSRLEKRGQTLPTKRQGQNGESEQMDTEPTQVKGEAPQNEAAADSSKTEAPVDSANATEGAGAAKDPEAVLQGLQLLTKAAANARDTTGSKAAQSSEIQNSASV
uniref:Uncharacterized protein n=1 Tax=Entomoneis paludosa TaxID=265537 RepID=A0A7S3DQ60_9STRA|mmetsp:Transcript_27796/g.58205  ORF Transcript_27796/g.58205 Transcript_27796/m.58205 type:complete len:240 (+) Transcript_27796:398-1117(+)